MEKIRKVVCSMAKRVVKTVKNNVASITTAVGFGLSGVNALAEGDPSTGLTAAVTTATTLFNSVAVLAVGAITFGLLVKYLRKGAK